MTRQKGFDADDFFGGFEKGEQQTKKSTEEIKDLKDTIENFDKRIEKLEETVAELLKKS